MLSRGCTCFLKVSYFLTQTWDRYDTHKLSSNFWDSSQQNAQLRELAGDYCDCCFAHMSHMENSIGNAIWRATAFRLDSLDSVQEWAPLWWT